MMLRLHALAPVAHIPVAENAHAPQFMLPPSDTGRALFVAILFRGIWRDRLLSSSKMEP